MYMEKEIRSFSVPVSNVEGRTISGMAVVFESWSRNLGGFIEIIRKGAITQDVIDTSDIIANFNHDDNYMLARSNQGKGSLTLELRDDGLYFEYQAPNTEKGNELLEHIKRGEIDECSFAFTISSEKGAERWYFEDNVQKREILKIDRLYDVSCVTHAAYGATSCTARGLENAINERKQKIDDKYNEMLKEIDEFIIK